MTMTTPHHSEPAREAVAPCPFCGSAGTMIACMGSWAPGGYEPDGRRIACSNMECITAGKPFYGEGMEANAIAWWNRRASPAPPRRDAMAEKMDLNALHEIPAQIQPLREPDSLYMTEATREKIKAAVEMIAGAKSEVPGMHFAGMEILCYPAGTVVFNTKTNQRAIIDENSVLSAIRADIVIVEPAGRRALEQNNG